MSDSLSDQQIREACIRMEGSAETRREILAKVRQAREEQEWKCTACGQVQKAVLAPFVREIMCQKCGHWMLVNTPHHPVMDMSDEIAKLRWERDRLSAALNRATDQLVYASKRIGELESALKAKLF